MTYFKIYIILCLLFIQFTYYETVETNEQDILTEEERNLRCCSQKLSCCDKTTEPTSFEVRAVLVKCPNQHKESMQNAIGGTVIHTRKRKNVNHDDLRCRSDDETVRKCEKKVKLTIKMKNTGFTNCKNQYILIDHVFDSTTDKKQKLQNPYVLKIRQFPIMQTYGMVYESMVNLEAKEKVHNKHDHGYSGCNVDPSSPNPTCGTVKYKTEPIPYSNGFCCGCDEKNLIYGLENSSTTTSFSLDHFTQMDTFGGLEEKGDVNIRDTDGFIGPVGKHQVYQNAGNNGLLPFAKGQRLTGLEVTPKVFQKRGGQDCSDKLTPGDANPTTYHASAHCLEFSDVWYAVFRLDAPKIYHLLSVQIYEKNQDAESGCKWRDLTQRTPIYVGSEILHYTDEQNTIAINYFFAKKKESGFSLNHRMHKLLIPDTTNIDISKYPELCGGPPEFLVIKDHEIRANGKTCNVAGVGYEAFVKQPDRCAVPQGSCLQNQPKQMWMHDHEAEERGKKGCYFLKFFGLLPLIPIQVNSTTQNKTLRMYFTESYTNILDIEIRADANVILRPNSLVTLTEVYIDSTHQSKTSITAKVFNSGLVSGVFMVSLTNCPLSLPASFSNINSRPVLVAPQYQHVFNLEIDCPLPTKQFICSLQVLNADQKILAIRKIHFRKLDRCFCIWYCSCACLLRDGGLKCKAITLKEYHTAGFQGSMPIPVHIVQYSFVDDILSTMFLCLLIVCLTLLIMGFIKGIVGYFSIVIGEWGFDVLLGFPKEMDNYHERDLQERSVMYDSRGYPTHPDTGQRVRNISYPAELCINLIFFIVYPFALIWMSVKKVCFPSYAKESSPYEHFDECLCKNGKQVQRKNSSLQNNSIRKSAENVEGE